jgi:hypothetical protein
MGLRTECRRAFGGVAFNAVGFGISASVELTVPPPVIDVWLSMSADSGISAGGG